ncbi:MAG: hypothetical protein GPJ54_04210 [Candidatus Heimdallarchaeota archaeon]|nr:hypothetical protein [Candidatus Heimdallarchaeota archaeon]
MGCIGYEMYTQPKDVVSIFFEWDNLDNFNNYKKSNSDLDNSYRKIMECYHLNLVAEWVDKESINSLQGNEIYDYNRFSIDSFENFMTSFSKRYTTDLMKNMGVIKYQIFHNYRNKNIISYLEVWKSKELYNSSDDYYDLTSSNPTLTYDGEIKFTDNYIINLETSWHIDLSD